VVLGEAVARELAVAETELAKIGSQFGGSLTVSVADELIPWVAPLVLDVAESNPRLRVNLTMDTRTGAKPDIHVRRVSKSVTGAIPISMVVCQSVVAAIAPRQLSVADLPTLPVCTLGHTPN
ncbi:hypothetical protein, partial [Klebsiella pneumoniae]|uniref:hypothetical protein n=1 Tax=Klebsiella pneumoniae TaxID=573 RepID=UPI00215887BF